MEIQSLTFAGLVALGAVNVVLMFKPNLDSKIKFLLSFAVAFFCLFVPTDLGNVLFEKAKEALQIAFAFSGVYKLATKVGGS